MLHLSTQDIVHEFQAKCDLIPYLKADLHFAVRPPHLPPMVNTHMQSSRNNNIRRSNFISGECGLYGRNFLAMYSVNIISGLVYRSIVSFVFCSISLVTQFFISYHHPVVSFTGVQMQVHHGWFLEVQYMVWLLC